MFFHNNVIPYIGNSYDLTTAFVGVSVLILVRIIYKLIQFRKLPPGPWGVPILGYVPFMSEQPHRDFARIGKTYGDVFSLQLGSRLLVVFNSNESIKKAFKNSATDGKPQEGAVIDYVGKSVFVADGILWKRQKNFLLSAMRNLGFGKSRMEEIVQHEIMKVIDDLTSSKGEPYDITILTKKIASNVIIHFTFKHESYTTNEFLENSIIKICQAADDLYFLSPFNLFPKLLSYFPNRLTGMKFLLDFKKTMYDHLEKLIDHQEDTYDNNYMRNLIDIFVRYKSKEAKNPNHVLCDRELFKGNVLTLFQAGMSTTEAMMSWIFQILAAHPNIQKAVQAELDEAVGREQLPSVNDVKKMPYTQAVLLEMDRYVSLLPLTFYHRATENMLFEGYEIPKNTTIVANLWNVHNAPDLWTEPEKFDPSRFLDKKGEIILDKAKNVVAFSIGNRSCLGEPLARMELFLVLTIFLQKFFFALPKGEIWKFQPDVYSPAIRCNKSMICAIPRR